MDRVLISVPLSEDSARMLKNEQVLCRIMLQAPAGTVLKRSMRFLSLVAPDPKCQKVSSISLWDELPRSKLPKFCFDSTAHTVLLGPTGKGMSMSMVARK